MKPTRRELLRVVSRAGSTAGAGLFCAGGARAQQPLKARAWVVADQIVRRIPRELYGTTVEWRDGGSGLWSDDLDALDPDVIRLTREFSPWLVRFPGGLLTDFYHWKKGIGPRDAREVTEAWPEGPYSKNSLGTDEALDFARQIDGQLLISVNVGSGSAEEAADWVRYVNGGSPSRVKYWEVGNELYNTGGFAAAYVSVGPDVYGRRFAEFAKAMRREDPTIRIGAIGVENYGHYILSDYPDWTANVLQLGSEEIDFLAVHNAYAPVTFADREHDVREVYTAMLAQPQAIRRNLRDLGTLIEMFVPQRQSEIRLAVTEWGPLFDFAPGPYTLHVRTLGSALYIASVLKQLIDTPRVVLSCTFNLLSDGFIGWIAKRGEDYILNSQCLALMMYSKHFGDLRVNSYYGCTTFQSERLGILDAQTNVPTLDFLASLSDNRDKLWIMGINKHFDLPMDTVINISSFNPASEGTAWLLSGTGIDAQRGADVSIWGEQVEDGINGRFSHGSPEEVQVTSTPVTGIKSEFTYRFPARSVTCIEIPRRR